MTFDFSLLRNIDFTDKDNLIFLSIILIAIFIVLCFFVVFVVRAVKTIKEKGRTQDMDVKKYESGQSQLQDNKVTGSIPRSGIIGSGFAGRTNLDQKIKDKKQDTAKSYKEKEAESISEGLDRLKNDSGKETLESKMPQEEDAAESYKKAEEENISGWLNKLRDNSNEDKETLESKMPAIEKKDGDDKHEEIEIPKAKSFSNSGTPLEAKENASPIEKNTRGVSGFEKVAVATSSGFIRPTKPAIPARGNRLKPTGFNKASGDDKSRGLPSKQGPPFPKAELMGDNPKASLGTQAISSESLSEPEKPFFPEVEFIEKDLTTSASGPAKESKVKIEQSGNKNQSIFSGGSEVSRAKLEYEMKMSPKIWEAGRQAGLILSPVERAKLVKEVFPSALGRNISKTDLKLGIRKLNQKMLGTKDPKEHAKIRKEIKFFKKIGGINN